ncbi:MAG: tetratricopeptide repeat protein [Lachnospiraceae bacterium]|nr:tetratricopeptide repeat protein [Lachnospiraceae bacterium]
MRCYNCGSILTKRNTCPGCGAEVGLYKKIIVVSNRYYNDGLEKASVRDLSGAKNSLRQCLKMNKGNIDARNLLGLIYYETGEIVSALSEWVISKNLLTEGNIADDYMDMIRSNPQKLDATNQIIKKYNIALKYCNKGTLDLAIIQLKKVLSINPGYLRAHLLLCLLYLNNGNYAKAKVEAEKTLKLDTGNIMAKRYLAEAEAMIVPGDTSEDDIIEASDDEVVRYHNGNEMIIQPKKGASIRAHFPVWGIALGILLGIGAASFLILPSQIQKATESTRQTVVTISEQSDAKSAQLVQYEKDIAALQKELEALQGQISTYEGTDSSLAAVNKLMEATAIYLSTPDDMDSIAQELDSLDLSAVEDVISDEFTDLYSSLMNIIGAQLAVSYYNTGYEAYKSEDYETAIANLTKACQYDETNVNAFYYLGNSYYNSGDTDNAKVIYDQVITDFPNTQSAQAAEAKLAEINNASN